MRHPATILLFMVCVAGVVGAMNASGVAAWLGVQPETGIEDNVDTREKKLKDYSASRGSSDTSFIGATISGVDETVASFVIVFGLADLLINAGLPAWGAALIASPLTWSFGLFMIYMISGRSQVRPR